MKKFSLKSIWFFAIVIAMLIFDFLFIFFNNITISFYNLFFVFIFIVNVLILLSSFINIKKMTLIISSTLAILILAVFISTTPIFHSKDYKNMILENADTKAVFSKDVTPTDETKIRLVTKEVAEVLADKKLWELWAIWSTTKIWEFSVQKFQNNIYWFAPLEFRGFWSRISMKTTPWYVLVSATNPSDVKIITQVWENKLKLKYLKSSWFFKNIWTHAYIKDPTKFRTDWTFEVDDEWNPFYAVSIYKPTIWFSWFDVIWVELIDIQTWIIKYYPKNEVPKWVDRIEPEEFIDTQLWYYWEYIKWFQWFTQTWKFKPTTWMSLVFDENENSKWFSSLTSKSADQSSIWFVLVDTRTKQMTQYQISGATEEAAMQAAQWKVQQFKYTATFPTLYNIWWKATYVMSMLDSNKYIKMVALVSVEDISIVSVWENIWDALREYKDKINSSWNVFTPDAKVVQQTVTWTISRISDDIRKWDLYKYIVLENVESKAFVWTSNVSKELLLSKVWDKVTITYFEWWNKIVDIQKFDNLDLSF